MLFIPCFCALLVSKFSVLYLCLTRHIGVLPSCSFVSCVLNLLKQEHCAQTFCSLKKRAISEEETHQTEQTLVRPEVKLSQGITVKSRDCFCTFFPILAIFLYKQSYESSSFVIELHVPIWEHKLFSIPFSEIHAMEGSKAYVYYSKI